MIENRRGTNVVCHAILIVGGAFVAFPLYIAVVTATLTAQQALQVPLPLLPGGHLWANVVDVWQHGSGNVAYPFRGMMENSFIMAIAVTLGKLIISVLSAYAIDFSASPCAPSSSGRLRDADASGRSSDIPDGGGRRQLAPHQHVCRAYRPADRLRHLDVSLSTVFPGSAGRTGRSGAGRRRRADAVLLDIALPLTKTVIAALFVIDFIYGWNQYLWPILATNVTQMITAVVGVKSMMGTGDVSTPWELVMAATLLTMLPPLVVVMAMQRWFVRGLVESEK